MDLQQVAFSCLYRHYQSQKEARHRALLAEAEQGRLAAPARTAGRVALAGDPGGPGRLGRVR